jgi:hypothetical protein
MDDVTQTSDKPSFLSDKTYNVMKRFVQIVLPAFSTLYFSLSGIWDLPMAKQVVGTAAMVATFLGVVLGFSAKSYNANDANFDGSMLVAPNADGGQVFSLILNGEPEDLIGKKVISFRVDNT